MENVNKEIPFSYIPGPGGEQSDDSNRNSLEAHAGTFFFFAI